MFGRWFNAGLRAAERAHAEGRLDQAYERLITLEINSPGALELREQIARGLLARARLGHRAGLHADALADIERAARLGPLDADSVELRRQAQRGLEQKRDGAGAADRAAQRLREGRLDSAREAACQLEDTLQRRTLLDAIDGAQRKADRAMEQARTALRSGDIATAARVWSDAHRRPSDGGPDPLGREIAAALAERIYQHYEAGALDHAARDAELVTLLPAHDPQLAECRALTADLRHAGALLAGGDYADLRETLLRLKARRDAKWLTQCLGALTQIVTGRDGLLASPLGRLANVAAAPGSNRDAAASAHFAHDSHADHPLPPTVLLVDGAASALLLDKSTVRIGRAGSGHALDVAIPGDISSRHADIECDGDDFFLIAHGPTTVNRQPARRVLLRDGDRIQLGARTKLRFLRPTSRSQSAVLRLSNGMRLAHDVSMIVLFRDTLMIGRSQSCHIQTRDTKSRVTVFERGGGLWARLADERGRPVGAPRALASGAATDFEDVRIAMTAMPKLMG